MCVCVYMYVLDVCFESGELLQGEGKLKSIILCLKLQVDENDPLGGENSVYEREEACWRSSLNRMSRWNLVLCLSAWILLFPFS